MPVIILEEPLFLIWGVQRYVLFFFLQNIFTLFSLNYSIRMSKE